MSQAIVRAASVPVTIRPSMDPFDDCRRLVDSPAFREHCDTLCTGDRSVEKRHARARTADVLSALYRRVLQRALAEPGAASLLARLQDRQELTRAGFPMEPPLDAVEALILDVSDDLARLKDPCHRSVWKHRRTGIARLPESAMPFFRLPLRNDRDAEALASVESVTWILLADRDALEWVEDPFLHQTFWSEAGDEYSFFAPAPNLSGDVPIRRFCRSIGLSRASEYRIRERRAGVGHARVYKADSDIVGLHESADGLVVNLEAHALDLIERRSTRWVKNLPVLVQSAPIEETATLPPPVADDRRPRRDITPTEQMLAFLEADLAAKTEALRRELLEKINAERAAGEFVHPDVVIDLP